MSQGSQDYRRGAGTQGASGSTEYSFGEESCEFDYESQGGLISRMLEACRSMTDSDLARMCKTASRNLVDRIMRHPAPSLLMGAGMAWLLMEETGSGGRLEGSRIATPIDRSREYLHEAADAVRGVAGGAAERISHQASRFSSHASEGVSSMRESLTAGAETAGQRMRSMGKSVRGGASTGAETIAELVERYPLAAGAAALGLGLVAGLLIPSTEQEEEWIGETAHAARERAMRSGEELLDRGREAVQAATSALSREMESQGLTPGALKEKVGSVASKAVETAKQTASGEAESSESGQQKGNASGQRSNGGKGRSGSSNPSTGRPPHPEGLAEDA